MNILHTETLKKWGGQQNRVLTEAVGLNKRGHKVIIACNNGSMLAQKAKQAGIKTYELNMSKFAHPFTIPKLIWIIKNENVDIVSTHSSVDSWAGGIAAKLADRKLVRFRHNLYPIGKDPLTKLVYSMPDAMIVTSAAVKDVLKKSGLKRGDITVMPSAVNTDRFSNNNVEDLRGELNISREALMIGNTSTFTEVKGQEYLLQGFNIIAEKIPCILLFAGRLLDQFKWKYLSHVKEKFRDKVIFLGHRDDIPRVLKTIDIFVFPSVLESTSTALLEAMAMQKPLVLSDIPTFKEFIIDRANGLYFRVKDPQDLAEKVMLLAENNSLKEQLGRNARETVVKNFSIEKLLDATEKVYKEALNV